MAPPSQGQMHPSRYLIALGAIFVVLFGVVFGFGQGSFSNRLKPRLGLDLVGGSTLTLVASSQTGQLTAENMETARQIIQNRVGNLGVSEAEVVIEGENRIVISAPGNNEDTIRQVGTPAQLRFRKVLNMAQDVPEAAATPSPSASGSASPSASPAASAKPSATATPTPTATQPATPTPSASAAPSGSATPGPSTSADLDKARDAMMKKLGSVAVATASQLQDSSTATNDPATMAQLAPFYKLTADEVALLPAQIQFNVPQVTCDKLNHRAPGSIVDMTQKVVACEKGGHEKYLLDVAKVEGTDVSSATAAVRQNASDWEVNLSFTGGGADKWTTLTREAYGNEGNACSANATVQRDSGSGNAVCRVAVVLDNEVVSAPGVQAIMNENASIYGSFTKADAKLLASQLKYGALPLTFQQGSLDQVSASLGTDYLRAGLLAAAIGLVLVIAYAFFYYRLLGSVIMLSLLLSGLLTYGMLVVLGRQIGFTLSLAGIAGFIVSLGVAADSFVIYFERLKDEIREGRSARSAVPRAWTRARRTIITANAVTILAAVVLYLVGVGQVRGFAFALGLATTLDLVIVFLFRHPMMTLLARTPAFLSPRVSGLGRVLHHAKDDGPSSRTSRPKEA